MEVLAVLGILVAAAAGFYFGRNNSGNAQDLARLESDLKSKQEELDAFRAKVSNHFETTANLFNQVSDSYQSLYDHMATSSNQLCSTPSFQSLPKSKASSKASDDDSEPSNSQLHKTNTDANDMFDANKLYNAHGYRTSAAEPIETKPEEGAIGFPPPADNKVVDIETAKEDKAEPALDYAIKDKGVVNHNSLNMDDAKSS
jgi:uncharacterized membrane-anchored protein YhcB (DUF1043 family)